MPATARVVVATIAALWMNAASADISTADRFASFVATRDAVLIVEANRQKIIARLVQQHRDALSKHGISVDTFAAALRDLPAERLLAASFANSIDHVHYIVAETVSDASRPEPKDGPGTGANSWIGYTGGGNIASGASGAVAAGASNIASGQGSFVGAGTANQANGISSLVIGGFDNRAVAIDSLVGAGAGNRATGARSVVVGGGYNLASGQWSFIGGGGRSSTVSTPAGTNTYDNVAVGDFSTIGGGRGNRSGGVNATIAGGFFNDTSAESSTVCGGSGNTASGRYSTVAGGNNNKAYGEGSFAAGHAAIADEAGMFVWADDRGYIFRPADYRPPGQSAHTFNVRATGIGGVYFATGISATGTPTWACYAQNGAGWTCTSDRNVKRNLVLLDGEAVLSEVAALPVYRWQAKDGPRAELQHIGPMAQDFYAAFGLGDSDKAIGLLDASGVALAAIQGLNIRLEQKDGRIQELEAKVQAQQEAYAELRRSVELLLARSSPDTRIAQQ